MTIKVEITDAPDLHLLADIHAACFANGWSPEAIGDLLKTPGTVALVAQENSGFALIRQLGEEAEVLTLAVLPTHRQQGIGGAIVHSMMHWGGEKKIRAIFLEVSERNKAARKLYGRRGFKVISRRKEYYRNSDGSHDHALVMRCLMK